MSSMTTQNFNDAVADLQEAVREVSYEAWCVLETIDDLSDGEILDASEDAAEAALDVDLEHYMSDGSMSRADAEKARSEDCERIGKALAAVREAGKARA